MSPPTGSVTFYLGAINPADAIGTDTLSTNVNGVTTAAFSTYSLPAGTYAIAAVYSGGTTFATSTSAILSQTVNKDNTTTTATASPGFANLGQAVTFTATVTANSPGSGTPTGTVDFYDTSTNTDLTPGGVALSSGMASFSTTSLAAGSHIIKATYSGDTNFLTSNGSAGTVTIGQTIFVLDPSAGGALSLSGNASIKIGGGVFVDSSSSIALSASGNASVKASVIDVHGGVQKSGNATFSPAPVTGDGHRLRPARRVGSAAGASGDPGDGQPHVGNSLARSARASTPRSASRATPSSSWAAAPTSSRAAASPSRATPASAARAC